MKIDYVVFSSNDNETYLDFYEPVAKVWNKRIGIPVIFLHIMENNELENDFNIERNEYGFYIKVKSVKGVSTAMQSQIIRLFSCQLFRDLNLLISDVDMIPISKEYFVEKAKEIDDDEVYIYTGSPYGNVPYYPMCYILGNGAILHDIILGGKHVSYKNYSEMMLNKYNGVWETDEKFFYDRCCQYNSEKIKIGSRNFRIEKRLDRGTAFDVTQDLTGFVDSHSIRPYYKYKDKIDFLIERLINE